MTQITNNNDPSLSTFVDPKVKSFQFEDIFFDEDGQEVAYLCKGEYFDDPHTFKGVVIDFCEVDCLGWSNVQPDGIQDDIKQALEVHFTTTKITMNCTINLI